MAGNVEAMDDLRHILTSREPLYSKADMALDTSGHTVESSLAELQQAVAVSRLLGKVECRETAGYKSE
jgi:XRE family aerobic/anaerobic benzoate catabolism transcriptional regulator